MKTQTSAFCVYIGPSVHGSGLISGTVFKTDRAGAVEELALTGALTRCPLAPELIVSGDALAESRLKVKTPGNLLYDTYRKAVAGL